MKHLFNPEVFKKILVLLVLILIIKTLWFVIEILWLPSQGITQEIQNSPKSLYYRVKLTPNQVAAPVVDKKPVPVKEGNMKDIKLLAIYADSELAIVAVKNKGKSKVLSRGDNINGFVLESAGLDYAIFSKNSKTYKVRLLSPKSSTNSIVSAVTKQTKDKEKSSEAIGEVTDLGNVKVIDKSLLEHYANNMDDIYKDIGITEVKNGRDLEGFRLTFVRKDSAFAKLGVRRDDVIKEINGQKITSYNAALEVYKNIKNVENLTLKINRGKEEMELEYEIN